MEEVASGSMEPRRRDQRADFEHGAVIGETVDDVLHEFLRQLHVLAVAKHSESVGGDRRDVTSFGGSRSRRVRCLRGGVMALIVPDWVWLYMNWLH